MVKRTATISQYGEKIPFTYSLKFKTDDGRNNFTDDKPIETCCYKLEGHYILGSRNYFLGCNTPDNSHHAISSQGSVTEFGIAHTAKEADIRLYTGIVRFAIGFDFKDEIFEIIDETDHAEKK